MEQVFPVNSGNVPPPSQSNNLLSHQLVLLNNAMSNYTPFQNSNNNVGIRRKVKDTGNRVTTPKLKLERILGLTSASNNVLSTANDLVAYAAGAVVVLYNHRKNKQVALLYPPQQTNTNANNNNNTANSNSNNNNGLANNGNSSNNMAMSAILAGSNNNNANDNSMLSVPLIQTLGSSNAIPSAVEMNANIATDEKKKSTPASTRAKPISCLAFSPDGKYLAVGEMGHQPRIFIWDVKEKMLIKEFKSHKFGVLSLFFSPNMRYLVSVGFQHDGYLYVWDWKKGIKLAGNKVTSRVNALSFSKDGTYFVTAGLRHVKFWYLDTKGRIPKRQNLSSSETQVLDGRSGILGVLRDANFVDVACSNGHTYFITDTGILCIFKEGRVIDKWVDLQVKNSFSISVSSTFVICTCSDGIIRLFEPVTLKYIGILPKPHSLGTDITLVTSPDMIRPTVSTTSTTKDETILYPDAVAMVYDDTTKRVTAVYSDRSLYVWDIHDLTKVGKYRSFIFHSDCVWGVEPCPNVDKEDSLIPSNSFATFSGDGTIRIWNLDSPIHHSVSSSSSSPLSPPPIMSPSSSTTVGLHRRNIYSRELVKMIYVDNDAAEFAKFKSRCELSEDQYPDFGVRSIKMSSDGSLMASGDRSGNLRVHDMNTWELLNYQEAHDSEILSIDMTTSSDKEKPSLIATASRDRLLHIFDIRSKFQLVQSLDDHSSSITSVKFSDDASKLISCGADKGIIFRNRTHLVTPFHDNAPRPYSTYHNYSGRSTVFDMALDVNERYVATVTGERKLYILSVESGKPFRVCKPETQEEIGKYSESSGGSLINIDLDPFSGTFAVTSGSDRCVRLFDLTNSSCIEKICAHSELITSVKFIKTNNEENGLRVISTCSDGTVFIWKVSREMVAKMRARASEREQKMRQKMTLTGEDDFSDNLLMSDKQKKARRMLNAAVIKPTASISQMIRQQGERKTFSTMSTTEQKYDDMYKRITVPSTGRAKHSNHEQNTTAATSNNNNIPNSNMYIRSQQLQSIENNTSSNTTATSGNNKPALHNNRTSNILHKNNNTKVNTTDGRKSPPEKIIISPINRLERLYNGLPTRERALSQVSTHPNGNGTTAAGMVQHASRLNSPISPRTNQVLRRAVSRDTLLKKETESRKSPTKTNLIQQQQKQTFSQRETLVPKSKTSQQQPIILRRSSDPEKRTVVDTSAKPSCEKEEDEESEEIDDTDVDAHNRDGDDEQEEDDVEEEDDEEEESYEEIIFTPEQEKAEILKPFEVLLSTHTCAADYPAEEDGNATTAIVFDNEAQEEDGSSEDNDDAINRDIVAREAPSRMSTSLSRTAPSTPVKVNEVKRRSLQQQQQNQGNGSLPPFAAATPTLLNTSDTQQRPSKLMKRQSLTSRFLSSLVIGGSSGKHDRPSIDSILSQFGEQQKQPLPKLQQQQPLTEGLVTTARLEKGLLSQPLTIDIATPIIPKPTIPITNSPPPSPVNKSQQDDNATTATPAVMTETKPLVVQMDENTGQKLENALADLEGASILLDSVLETYMSIVASKHASVNLIETKLNGFVEKIGKVVDTTTTVMTKPSITGTQASSPETLQLLEKYSSLLMNMMENKMNRHV